MYKSKNKQTASMEDYLEAAIILEEKGEKVTVTALSEALGVKKPSVDWAMKKLSSAGLVVHERYKDIELTPEGVVLASEVYRRHKVLYSFLTDVLKVDTETAEEDACQMEHNLSSDSINRLDKFLEFILHFHPGLGDWEDIFNRYIKNGKDDDVVKELFSHPS